MCFVESLLVQRNRFRQDDPLFPFHVVMSLPMNHQGGQKAIMVNKVKVGRNHGGSFGLKTNRSTNKIETIGTACWFCHKLPQTEFFQTMQKVFAVTKLGGMVTPLDYRKVRITSPQKARDFLRREVFANMLYQ